MENLRVYQERLFKKIFLGCFFIILLLPVIFINTDENKISILENKKVNDFSEWFKSRSKFENYLNENIGFRDEAILANIIFKFVAFQKLDLPNYSEGKNGELFYVANGSIATWQGRNLLNEVEMGIYKKNLVALRDYFKENQIPLLFATIPDKENIYPELYLNGVTRYSDKTRIDVFTEYLKNTSDLNIISLKNSLWNKRDEQVYYKAYDPTHWNMNGAYIGYNEIMLQIKNILPDINIVQKDEFLISVTEHKGTLGFLKKYNFLNQIMDYQDNIYQYKLIDDKSIEVSHTPPNGVSPQAVIDYYHYHNKDINNGKTLLVLGDSYIYSFLLPILSKSFSDVYFTRLPDAETIVAFQKEVHPDVVLFETVERMFFYLGIKEKLHSFQFLNPIKFLYTGFRDATQEIEFHIDMPVLDNNVIQLNEKNFITEISGWSILTENKTGDCIYAKVGANYYEAEIIDRPDIAAENKNCLKAGFKFNIPTEQLKKEKLMEFIIIDKEKGLKYPIKVQIKTLSVR